MLKRQFYHYCSTVKTITTNVDDVKTTEVLIRSKISRHGLSASGSKQY